MESISDFNTDDGIKYNSNNYYNSAFNNKVFNTKVGEDLFIKLNFS